MKKRFNLAGRRIFLVVMAVSLCLTAPNGRADIYRWQDNNGTWHFSDSPTSEAPIRQAPVPSVEQRSAKPDRSAANDPSYESTGPTPHPFIENPASSSASGSASGPLSEEATADLGGLLWRVTSPEGDDSHLLGTIHSADPRVVQLRPAVAQALDRCERFVMEMEMDASVLTAFGGNMMLTDGSDLEELIGAALYAQVVAAMADLGMPEMVVRTLKPWVVMALLSMPAPTGEPFLDLVLQQRAGAAGKPTFGLESAGEQLSIFEALSMSDQIELLKMTLAQLPELPRMFEQLIEAYVADDLGRIGALAADYKRSGDPAAIQRFILRLNDERNGRMAQRMHTFLDQGSSFIAVGALHLTGPNGLIQLLREQGYRVVPVR